MPPACPKSAVQPRPFSHRDAGTPETTWLLDTRWDFVPRLPLVELCRQWPRVVLIAPHPDDETLAVGATLSDLADAGVAVTVVIATHGGTPDAPPVRRQEGDRAIRALHPRIEAVWWDLPDGGLAAAERAMRAWLTALVDDSTLVLAPIECDGHTDHEAVARAAEAIALARSAALLLYPVWLWHWATPDDVEWDRARTLAPSLRALRAKRAAVECHSSQLSADDGHPIVGPSVLTRAHRVFETVFVPQHSELAARVTGTLANRERDEVARPFDAMYSTGESDPWRLDDSPYERRRLRLLLACLGRERYGRTLEIGCASGQLTSKLRERADVAVGLDASDAALSVARARGDDVHWVLGAAPRDIPDEDYDLVVASEIGYFLDGVELLTTLRAVRGRLRPNGEFVVANWRRDTTDVPLDGPTVQQQIAEAIDLPRRARYEDVDLLIDVYGQPISVYDEAGGDR